MIYGYLRVSSDEQDVNSQKQGVDGFAADKGWRIDEYITDEGVSGGKDPDRRNLQRYVNEFVFRYNLGGKSDSERFNLLLCNSKTHVTHKEIKLWAA